MSSLLDSTAFIHPHPTPPPPFNVRLPEEEVVEIVAEQVKDWEMPGLDPLAFLGASFARACAVCRSGVVRRIAGQFLLLLPSTRHPVLLPVPDPSPVTLCITRQKSIEMSAGSVSVIYTTATRSRRLGCRT